MTYDDVITHYGGVDEAAEALGLTNKAVYKWKYGGINSLRQCMIELAAGPALKADPSSPSGPLAEHKKGSVA